MKKFLIGLCLCVTLFQFTGNREITKCGDKYYWRVFTNNILTYEQELTQEQLQMKLDIWDHERSDRL
jgi:hypothetical protein